MKKILPLLFILIFACTAEKGEERDFISLEGEWGFTIDSLDQGINDEWYNTSFDESVQLPGSMAENGKGDEVSISTDWTGSIVDESWFTEEKYARYRKDDNLKIPFWLQPVRYYKGPAWYQREFDLPGKWEDKEVFLNLERCHWESMVYINGQSAGSQNSLASQHRYNITTYLQAGLNTISVRMDNRVIIPVGVNSHSVSDHTQSNWNGITGRIGLEASSQVLIDDVQVYPDIHDRTAKVSVSIINHSGGKFEGQLEIQAEGFNTGTAHRTRKIVQDISIDGVESMQELDLDMGDRMQLWSEFDPALYTLKVILKDRQKSPVDQETVDFGMREFTTEGTHFQLNGRPIFLRGTTECCIFPLTGYPPSDLDSWEYLIKRCQEHGLNHMRFHSWCPPEAAFEAADKLGFYYQVECSSWANQTTAIGEGYPVDSFIYEEGDRILKAYGNHPSFCMMAYGNEPAGKNQSEYLGELLNYWKAKDRRRVYTSAAGWPLIPENDYHNAPGPRIQQWGEGLRSIINAEAPQTMYDFNDIISPYDIPYISHEIGQWCVYPNFEEISKYAGVLKAKNLEIFQETLNENNMGDLADDFLLASGKLQTLCYKADIEAALRTPGFAGFQMLQLHDFPGQGSALVGVLDAFFCSKGYVTPEEFRSFCNQTVPLARMEKRIFKNDETFQADIEIAHFGAIPLENVNIACQVINSAKEILAKESFPLNVIQLDNNVEAGSFSYPLGKLSQAEKLTLLVSIENSPYSNSWDFWVYPAEVLPNPGEAIHITSTLNAEAAKILDEGGSVLFLPYGSVIEGKGAEVEIGFSSIFWNTAWTRGQAPHTLGILCDPAHPFFESFPTEYHSNWQWWDPVSHSQAMILDEFPASLKPLIQPIDDWFENRRLALAFEAKAGNGKLMVCSIDMENDMEERPVTNQLQYSLIEYMKSDSFNPEIAVEISDIKALTGE
jgi:hypothetical protein